MILAMKESKELTKTKIGHLKKMFDDRDGVSMSQAARKFDCSKSLIN